MAKKESLRGMVEDISKEGLDKIELTIRVLAEEMEEEFKLDELVDLRERVKIVKGEEYRKKRNEFLSRIKLGEVEITYIK